MHAVFVCLLTALGVVTYGLQLDMHCSADGQDMQIKRKPFAGQGLPSISHARRGFELPQWLYICKCANVARLV